MNQELDLLLEAVFLRYGYDFRAYARASIERRVAAIMAQAGVDTVTALTERLLSDKAVFAAALPHFMVPTTEMFRDAAFFAALREQVFPMLQTYPTCKIWHAGCSTGEEVHSLAILLHEAGLLERSVIYATDISAQALKTASEGIYPLAVPQKAAAGYAHAGGRDGLSAYYTTAYGAARFDPQLRRNIVFATHNLAADDVFSEVHLVLCRNVFIYFTPELQARALDLFTRSLCYKGHLGLGTQETLRFLPQARAYEELPGGLRLYRKLLRGDAS